MATESRVNSWITFIGVMLLLLGIYGSVRTVINMYAFDKYPQGGVLSINLSGQPPYFQKETDCNYPPTPSYAPDGKMIPPSAEQAKIDAQNKANCLASVKDTREQAKVNDISQSLLFLFLGIGVLVSRRFFFK
jgi:hypothetical protein